MFDKKQPKIQYHNGPLDGAELSAERLYPEDAEYKIRSDLSGNILGAWWTPEFLEQV